MWVAQNRTGIPYRTAASTARGAALAPAATLYNSPTSTSRGLGLGVELEEPRHLPPQALPAAESRSIVHAMKSPSCTAVSSATSDWRPSSASARTRASRPSTYEHSTTSMPQHASSAGGASSRASKAAGSRNAATVASYAFAP
eukprot:scaffold2183_cov140-Isochrysis_galbana.AAC.13